MLPHNDDEDQCKVTRLFEGHQIDDNDRNSEDKEE